MTDIEYKRLMLKINDITKNLKRSDTYRASKEVEILRKMIILLKPKS